MEVEGRNEFGLTGRDMKTIIAIFDKYREVDEVRIFGSRAKGNYQNGSDIDLAISNVLWSEQIVLRLKEDFEESSLPYFVDIVYLPLLQHLELRGHIERVGKAFYSKVAFT